MQHLPASHPHHIQIWKGVLVRWALPAPLMRPMLVVVRDVLAHCSEQLSGVVNQNPVQALAPDRAHPALREGVRPGRLRGYEEYLNTVGVEHGVEHAGVLGVAMATTTTTRARATRPPA
jgi:hypothetical protein